MKKLVLSFLFLTAISNAQIVNIPDANFKARLLAANSNNSDIAGTISADGTYYTGGATIDLNGDGEIEVSEAQSIQYLAVNTLPNSPFAIQDLTGIQDFTNLEMLVCYFNNLTSLDLSNLTHLISVDCSDNQLTSLNLNGLFNLKYLSLRGNQITSFDFSGFPNLRSVNCGNNLLTSLDFSSNPLFFDLGCANNSQLTYINLKNGTTQNSTMGVLTFDGFTNCPNLHAICVDESERVALQSVLDWSELNWNGSHIVCSSTCLLSTNENQIDRTISAFPNPVRDVIEINSVNNIKSMQLFDVNGRILTTKITNDTQASLDVSNYAKGIYFLKVTTDKGVVAQKIVKQ